MEFNNLHESFSGATYQQFSTSKLWLQNSTVKKSLSPVENFASRFIDSEIFRVDLWKHLPEIVGVCSKKLKGKMNESKEALLREA